MNKKPGTQPTGTTTAKQVRSRDSNQSRKTGADPSITTAAEQVRSESDLPPLIDPRAATSVENRADQVPTNITDISTARARQNKRKSASQVRNEQSVETGVEREIGAKERQKTGADGTGAGVGTDLSIPGTKRVGRPKGSKDKQVRKTRYDNSMNTLVSEVDRGRIVQHNLELWRLGKLKDRNNVDEVRERVETYFYICAKNNVMPTVAGFALSLGIDRTTLWLWLDNKTGVIKNTEVLDALKEVYSMINAQYEALLTEGKGIPASSFFLMQNNFGYRNQNQTETRLVLSRQDEDLKTTDIAARAGLLEGDDDR